MDIVVQPLDRTLDVAPGANLLEALLAARVPMSYSCMSGRCGTCRCHVVDGQVLAGHGADQRPLDARDTEVLACQTWLTHPCTIRVPEPDEVVVHPARIVKATVAAIEDLTHDIRRLLLKPAKPIEFSPGQYVQLDFGSGLSRPYSMAGLPGDPHFEFHVRLVPGGRVTTHIAHTLKVGDVVKVSGPLGSAYLRRRHTGPILCVAGGTGLAPVLSILRGIAAGGMDNTIRMYFGVRSPADLYGMDELTHLQTVLPGLSVHPVLGSGADPLHHRAGLVTQAIEADLPRLDGWRAYLCGSPPMVEAASHLARQRGIPPEHIHADAFYAQGT